MLKILLATGMLISAVVSYLLGGANGAIIFSHLIHHQDIRDYGSGNPGFTNYKRVYGNDIIAWIVLIFDVGKTALCAFLTALCFSKFINPELWQFGAAFSGLFCMIGHCFPVWYKFKGGKAFMAGFATTWLVDWRMALIAMGLFLILLFTVKYMSVCSCIASFSCPVILFFLQILPQMTGGASVAGTSGAAGGLTGVAAVSAGSAIPGLDWIVWGIVLVSALLIIARHYPNFVKLKNHTETKFSLKNKK